jgi:heme exporter protein D
VGAPAENRGMSEFFAMGGYGFYVWGSYGVAALCICLEIFFLTGKKQKS